MAKNDAATVTAIGNVVRDVTRIILGTNKDGTPRSIVDAVAAIEKEKRKTRKKLRYGRW